MSDPEEKWERTENAFDNLLNDLEDARKRFTELIVTVALEKSETMSLPQNKYNLCTGMVNGYMQAESKYKERIAKLVRQVEKRKAQFTAMTSNWEVAEEEVKDLRAANRDLRSWATKQEQRVRELVAALDEQHGTPCEQIRHKQEVDELRARNAVLEADHRSDTALFKAMSREITMLRGKVDQLICSTKDRNSP